MPMNIYSFSLLASSKPSLMQHVETILASRPTIEVEAISFDEPDLWELANGKLVRHWPTWFEVTMYTRKPLRPEVLADLERQLDSEGQVTARQEIVVPEPPAVMPEPTVPSNSFLPIQVPIQVPDHQPTGFTALEDWPMYFKITPVVHVQPDETTA